MDNHLAERRGGSCWADPRVSTYLMISTYVIGGGGIALGMYFLSSENVERALHYALPLMVGVVGILSMIRHSVFHASDAARAGVTTEPFYMIELGFANGAMGILALLAFFADWGVAAEAAITLVFALYLTMAFFLFLARAMAEGLDGGRILALCMWLLQVGFMFYFAIAALASAGISPF
ncbi:MAG: hypothetical protein C4536_02465 [Actinobacteria bacterium]|jgi:hypothetical protein|nr:MAG: hypothetical protein C4536_02465 [Actinomycetota bacterium]